MALIDETNGKMSLDTSGHNRNGFPMIQCSAFNFIVQIPDKLPKVLKSYFKQSLKEEGTVNTTNSVSLLGKEPYTGWEATLEKQLLNWKINPFWVDKNPEMKVSVPKGSLCNLNVKFNVGLPPDAVYNIVIDPENRRVFKNIKEVISRRVLVDEGFRQVVEVEQAAIWRFLWLEGTISVHVIVDQNQRDHTVKFKQGKSGFMKRFEGCWQVRPLFVDEQLCASNKPCTLEDYDSCTGGKGRVGSVVTLDQLIQPSIVPPPPISWYLRGITTRTTEMLIHDLLAETARIRGFVGDSTSGHKIEASSFSRTDANNSLDAIKERWHQRRRRRRR